MTFEEYLLENMKIREECQSCPLHGKPVVLYEKTYEGNEKRCDVLFLGINPGKQEAKQGRPFIGPSGKILREKLEELKYFEEFNVAFTNAILCSTPNEKDIPDVEGCINNCKPLLRDIVKFLRPRVFVPVGRNCAEYLFGVHGSITKISGKKFGTNNNIVPLIHPASLIYSRGTGDNAAIFDESLKQIKKIIKCAPKDLVKKKKKVQPQYEEEEE